MKRFRFYLDNGRSFVVSCKDAHFKHENGMLASFVLDGVDRNKIEFLDTSSVIAVVALGPVDGMEDADMEESE